MLWLRVARIYTSLEHRRKGSTRGSRKQNFWEPGSSQPGIWQLQANRAASPGCVKSQELQRFKPLETNRRNTSSLTNPIGADQAPQRKEKVGVAALKNCRTIHPRLRLRLVSALPASCNLQPASRFPALLNFVAGQKSQKNIQFTPSYTTPPTTPQSLPLSQQLPSLLLCSLLLSHLAIFHSTRYLSSRPVRLL